MSLEEFDQELGTNGVKLQAKPINILLAASDLFRNTPLLLRHQLVRPCCSAVYMNFTLSEHNQARAHAHAAFRAIEKVKARLPNGNI